MAAKTVVLLFTVLALAAATPSTSRVKKQVIVGAYPYAAAPAPVVYAEDDGSYFPGKYEGTGFPYVGYPYSAYPYSAYPYAAAPAVAAAYPYAAAPVAPVVSAVPAPVVDDGSYFPGKYGPENIQ